MRRVVRQPQARRDIMRIADYIAEDSLDASDRFLDAAEESMRQLADMPGMGALRDYDNPAHTGMRLWPIPKFSKYLIFYKADEKTVTIIRVLHGAQNLQRIFGPKEE